MITLLLKLLLAHLAGDFLLQPDHWVTDKKQNKAVSPYLYLHIGIHALLLLVVLRFDFHYWLGMTVIIGSHYLIDLTKLCLQGKYRESYLFIVDQVMHLLVIAGVAALYHPSGINPEIVYQPKVILFLSCVVFVTYVTAVVMRMMMNYWKLEEDSSDDSLQHAGKYIGMIERLLVFIFVILNQWSAIGFLIAAKSILRFSDLSRAKDRKLTEYIIIGTLLSMAIAIATGMVYTRVATLLPLLQ